MRGRLPARLLSVLSPVIGTALAGALTVPPPAQPTQPPATTEMDWVADLGQGNPVNVVYRDGVPRPTAASGMITLPARWLPQPTDRVSPTLDATIPPGTSVEIEMRGRLLDGRWTEWWPGVSGRPTALPGPSAGVQLRVTLTRAGADRGAATPEVRGLRVRAEAATDMRVAAPGEPDSFQVYATRLGLLDKRTANGHRVTADDYFVALPSRRVLADTDGSEYGVKLCATGVASGERCAWAPVWDVGPWNTRDDYWSAERERFRSLPQGLPEAQAAFLDNHNDGKDGSGRKVRNPAGIDLSDRLFEHALGLTGTAKVTVTYLWTGGRALSRVNTASEAVTVRSAPTEDAPSVGLAANGAGVAVECATQRDPHRPESNQPKSAHPAPPASEAKTQRDPHRPESNQPKSAHPAPPASEAKTQRDPHRPESNQPKSAHPAQPASEAKTQPGWLRIGPGEYLPEEDVTLAEDVPIGSC